MKHTHTTLSAVLALSLCLASLPGRSAELPPLTLAGMEFAHMEVARTSAERATGLMERKWLDDDGGMVFLFEEIGPVTMWMKNTRIPLDCLFLDAGGRVLKVVTMRVEPPKGPRESTDAYEKRLPLYSCRQAVACVVELRAGMAKELGIRPGEVLPELSLRNILQKISLI